MDIDQALQQISNGHFALGELEDNDHIFLQVLDEAEMKVQFPLFPHPPGYMILFHLHLPESIRRKGFGTRIVQALQNQLNQRGLYLAIGPVMDEGMAKLISRLPNYQPAPPFMYYQRI